MPTPNPTLNQHPLELWRSPQVTALLVDFYAANFTKAGLPAEYAQEFVGQAWKGKVDIDYELLRKQGGKFLRHVKQFITQKPDEVELLSLFDLRDVSVFLDVGANKLTAINYYAQQYPAIKKLIGVDIIPQNKAFYDEARCEYYHVDPGAPDFPVESESVDYINIQYVLHHFDSINVIKETLKNCQRVLRPGGRLVLWEESFTAGFSEETVSHNNERGLHTDAALTKRFYELSEAERWEFIIVNDWLINVSNAHMPWTGQYYVWSDWCALVTDCGFILTEEFALGLRVNGRLRQGVPVIGVFTK